MHYRLRLFTYKKCMGHLGTNTAIDQVGNLHGPLLRAMFVSCDNAPLY